MSTLYVIVGVVGSGKTPLYFEDQASCDTFVANNGKYNTLTAVGSLTNMSTTMTVPVQGIATGATITGPGVPANTTVSSLGASTLVMSNAASADEVSQTYTFVNPSGQWTQPAQYTYKNASEISAIMSAITGGSR